MLFYMHFKMYYCYSLQSCGYVCHLLSLPDELLLMVLSNLDHKDLVKCMLVCRQLFHIASDSTLCKCLSIQALSYTCTKNYVIIVYMYLYIGKCIQLQKCSGVCDETLMWMRRKTPACVLLHNCKGTLSSGAIRQLFTSVAKTLKVSFKYLAFLPSQQTCTCGAIG